MLTQLLIRETKVEVPVFCDFLQIGPLCQKTLLGQASSQHSERVNPAWDSGLMITELSQSQRTFGYGYEY